MLIHLFNYCVYLYKWKSGIMKSRDNKLPFDATFSGAVHVKKVEFFNDKKVINMLKKLEEKVLQKKQKKVA